MCLKQVAMVSLSCKEPYRELTYLILIYDPQLLTQVTIHSTTKAETSLTLDGPYKSYKIFRWWGSNPAGGCSFDSFMVSFVLFRANDGIN